MLGERKENYDPQRRNSGFPAFRRNPPGRKGEHLEMSLRSRKEIRKRRRGLSCRNCDPLHGIHPLRKCRDLPGRFLGKQAGPWTCWERRALRRGLCLYARRVSDGKCGGGGEVPDPVSGHRKDPKRLHPGMLPPQPPDPQPSLYHGEEKSHADAEDRPHGTEVHPGKGDGVPVL